MKVSPFAKSQTKYQEAARKQELERVQQENQMLREQLKRSATQIQMANQQMRSLKQRYLSLVNELSVREKAAEEISRLALKEANQIIETARGNADLIVKEAMTNAKGVFIEISRLSKETSVAKQDIQGKLDNMSDMLDSFQIPEIPNLSLLAKKDSDEKQ